MVILTSPFAAAGWLILGASQNKVMLYFGQILTSIAVQLHYCCVFVYISETSHPDMRSLLVIIPAVFMGSGQLLVWTLMPFLYWRIMAYLLAIPCLLEALFLFLLPESPYWLVQNEQFTLAKKSLKYFRGNPVLQIFHK